MRRFDHPHIVRFLHSFERDVAEGKDGATAATLHIVMEYCDGGALDEEIANHKSWGQCAMPPRPHASCRPRPAHAHPWCTHRTQHACIGQWQAPTS